MEWDDDAEWRSNDNSKIPHTHSALGRKFAQIIISTAQRDDDSHTQESIFEKINFKLIVSLFSIPSSLFHYCYIVCRLEGPLNDELILRFMCFEFLRFFVFHLPSLIYVLENFSSERGGERSKVMENVKIMTQCSVNHWTSLFVLMKWK